MKAISCLSCAAFLILIWSLSDSGSTAAPMPSPSGLCANKTYCLECTATQECGWQVSSIFDSEMQRCLATFIVCCRFLLTTLFDRCSLNHICLPGNATSPFPNRTCPTRHWYFQAGVYPNSLEPNWFKDTARGSIKRTPLVCCGMFQNCSSCKRNKCR